MIRVTREHACCHTCETCMIHVTHEHACCHKWETNVKSLMLVTTVRVVADAALIGDDRVDALFTCNYRVWCALSVLGASVVAETPSAQCSGKDGL